MLLGEGTVKSNSIFVVIFSIVFLFSIPSLLRSANPPGISEQHSFALAITNNLINMKANQASVMDILRDLEKKNDIKVNIFNSVDDGKVTLNISSIPVYSVYFV